MATAPHLHQQPASPHAYGPGRQLITTVIAVLPESEYLLSNDAHCVQALVNGFNISYEFGSKAMMMLMAILMLVFAPFLGIAAAMYSFISALFRAAAVPVGRWFADINGYGTYVRTRAAYVLYQREKAYRAGTVALRLPTTGSRPNSRYPALPEDELLGQHPGIGLKPLLQAFNAAFSWGFVVGTVICTSLTFIMAPFIGMFVGGGTFLIALARTFSRNDGRFFTTLFGIADLVDQEVARMQEEMGIEHVQAQEDSPLSAGFRPRPGPGSGGASGVQQPAAQPLIGPSFAPVMTQPPVAQGPPPMAQYAYQPTAVPLPVGQYHPSPAFQAQAYAPQAAPAYAYQSPPATAAPVYQQHPSAVASAAPHSHHMQSQEDPGPAMAKSS